MVVVVLRGILRVLARIRRRKGMHLALKTAVVPIYNIYSTNHEKLCRPGGVVSAVVVVVVAVAVAVAVAVFVAVAMLLVALVVVVVVDAAERREQKHKT